MPPPERLLSPVWRAPGEPEPCVHNVVTPRWAVCGIGRDESEPEYHVPYADDRGISRIYKMTFANGSWRMWRDTPEFSQRFDAEVRADLTQITGSWQKSSDAGATWEHDFNVT
jgi:hypothetical protein